MMKGKSGVSSNVASSTLAYAGNSFRYSKVFTDDPQQKQINATTPTITPILLSAPSASSVCSNRLSNGSAVLSTTGVTLNKRVSDVSSTGSLQRRRKRPSENCDEIFSLSDEAALEPDGRTREHLQKETAEVLQKVEKDIQEIELSCKDHTQEVKNGPKKYKN